VLSRVRGVDTDTRVIRHHLAETRVRPRNREGGLRLETFPMTGCSHGVATRRSNGSVSFRSSTSRRRHVAPTAAPAEDTQFDCGLRVTTPSRYLPLNHWWDGRLQWAIKRPSRKMTEV